MDRLAFGVRGVIISVNAIKAATAKATVVKKPKTFWARTTVECMIALPLADLSVGEVVDSYDMEEGIWRAWWLLLSGFGSLALVVLLIPCCDGHFRTRLGSAF